MYTVALIQARYDSKRLPGKVLKKLAGRSILEWVVDAAKNIVGVDGVVVATSDEESDKPIVDFCSERGIPCFRGSKNDVLNRVKKAAESEKAKTVIRLTADCPFLDSYLASSVLYLHKQSNADYTSNVEPPTWPDGVDVEVIEYEVLKQLDETVKSDKYREHVTLEVRHNRSDFKIRNYRSPDAHLANHRWTIDNNEDYEFACAIADVLTKEKTPISVYHILSVLERFPDIEKKRSDAKRNEALSELETYKSRGFDKSKQYLDRAEKTIPLGSQTFSKSRVQFPAGHAPLFLSHGQGARVWDVDGNEYVDMVSGLLPVVLGYSDPDVDDAIINQLNNGITLSLSSLLEAQLAEKLVDIIPCAEKVRFGKNGTDATSAAVRLSRAYTGRDKVIACGYHGWQDWYIGATTRNLGVPDSVGAHTIRQPYNDLQAIENCLKENDGEIACLILEPASLEEPKDGYLENLKYLCEAHGVVLVFDEVVTGFRWHLGGAQAYYGVTPDLACFGKAIANGMPLSVVLGKAEIMDKMEDIFFSGTFAGETLSLAAALAVIKKMERQPVIERIWQQGKNLSNSVASLIKKYDLDDIFKLKGVDPWKIMMIHNHKNADTNAIKTRFIMDMVSHGVLTLGSHNISYAHSDEDLQRVEQAYDYTLENISNRLRNNTLVSELEIKPLVPVFQVRKIV